MILLYEARIYGGVMHNLVGKTVIVETFETTYIGKLVELGEQEVHLQSDNGWIVIPVERITSMREKID